MDVTSYRVPALPAFSGSSGLTGLPGLTGQGGFDPHTHCFRVECEIKRSRFLASLGHAPDRETARAFILAVKAEFRDATHNCWAYNAGKPGDSADIGQSDDGEPHGTAGKPMLSQILHADAGELVVVVTRYFGGIKLGTGGLVRAYQSCVAQALQAVPLREKTPIAALTATLDYAGANRLYGLVDGYHARITQELFGAQALFHLEVPKRNLDRFVAALLEATDGKAMVELV